MRISPTAPLKGRFSVLISPSGEVVAPDLVEPLIPILNRLSPGSNPLSREPQPCVIKEPKLLKAKVPVFALSLKGLKTAPLDDLWTLRTRAIQGCPEENPQTSRLDLTIAIGRRILESCTLCEHRCLVNRNVDERGFCELGAGMSVSSYGSLYNEGPLVGQPSFGVYVRGCSLRCRFCYRPDDLRASGSLPTSPPDLAGILDEASKAGVQSWHFLGGNPDESLVSILEALRDTEENLPTVWNSALYLSPEALVLLKDVVDIWLPDLKFGNDSCAFQVAGIHNYSQVIRRNLLALKGETVVIRHMEYPGHETCCRDVALTWIREHFPEAPVHMLRYVYSSVRDRTH